MRIFNSKILSTSKIISTNYNILENDKTLLCTNNITITLPDASISNGNQYNIKNDGEDTITINTFSTQTIDESNSIQLTLPKQSILLESNGSNWVII